MSEAPVNDRYEDDRTISLMARDQYLREVAWMEALEPFSVAEEEKLLGYLHRARQEPENAWAARRAQYARERLVEAYQPVVMAVARRAAGCFQSMEWLDLVNEGNVALLSLLDDYVRDEPTYPGTFRGLVMLRVRYALWAARYDADGPFRVPDRVAALVSRLRRVMACAEGVLSVQELAARLEVSEEQVLEAKACLARQKAVSLEGLIHEDDAEDRHRFVSLFQAEVREQHEHQVEGQRAFARLLEQELVGQMRRVVELRYAVDEGITAARPVSVVAHMLGIYVTDVCSLERRGLARLREVFADCSEVPDSRAVEARVESERWYTSREVAGLLGIKENSVTCLASRGRLPVVTGVRRLHGRPVKWAFPKEQIDALVRARGEQVREAVGA